MRAPVSMLGAVLTNAGEAPVVVLDLSSGGAYLQVDAPPEPDHEYTLHFNVHRSEYSAQFRVVRWSGDDGDYRWGCCFSDLVGEQRERLRRSVHAAAGLAETSLRDWDSVLADASAEPGNQVVVGCTAAGEEIRLVGSDCVALGDAGVELYVRTVAGLERV